MREVKAGWLSAANVLAKAIAFFFAFVYLLSASWFLDRVSLLRIVEAVSVLAMLLCLFDRAIIRLGSTALNTIAACLILIPLIQLLLRLLADEVTMPMDHWLFRLSLLAYTVVFHVYRYINGSQSANH